MNDSYKRLLNLVLDNRTDEESVGDEMRRKKAEKADKVAKRREVAAFVARTRRKAAAKAKAEK